MYIFMYNKSDRFDLVLILFALKEVEYLHFVTRLHKPNEFKLLLCLITYHNDIDIILK